MNLLKDRLRMLLTIQFSTVFATPDVPKELSNNRPHLSRQAQLEIKQKWYNEYIELEKIVNEWDPIGLIYCGAPDDEYDCLSMQILFWLHEGKTVEQIQEFIIEELNEHFGYGVKNIRKKEDQDVFLKKCNSASVKIVDWFKGLNNEGGSIDANAYN